eukprot:7385205-Lingulodinium_polyedra.AAC.1
MLQHRQRASGPRGGLRPAIRGARKLQLRATVDAAGGQAPTKPSAPALLSAAAAAEAAAERCSLGSGPRQ